MTNRNDLAVKLEQLAKRFSLMADWQRSGPYEGSDPDWNAEQASILREAAAALREPVKVTDEMVETALTAYVNSWPADTKDGIRTALEAALGAKE